MVIIIGEYKHINVTENLNKDIFIRTFVCSVCGKTYIYYGKGLKQFKKRIYAKGCKIIDNKKYCYRCWKEHIYLNSD